VPRAFPINLTRSPFCRLNCIPGKQIPGCQSTSESARDRKGLLSGSWLGAWSRAVQHRGTATSASSHCFSPQAPTCSSPAAGATLHPCHVWWKSRFLRLMVICGCSPTCQRVTPPARLCPACTGAASRQLPSPATSVIIYYYFKMLLFCSSFPSSCAPMRDGTPHVPQFFVWQLYDV